MSNPVFKIPASVVKKLQTGKINKAEYMKEKFGDRKIVKEYYKGNYLIVEVGGE